MRVIYGGGRPVITLHPIEGLEFALEAVAATPMGPMPPPSFRAAKSYDPPLKRLVISLGSLRMLAVISAKISEKPLIGKSAKKYLLHMRKEN